MSRMTSSGTATHVDVRWEVRIPDHRAERAWLILETICERTGHVGACGLLNHRYHLCIEVFGHWFSLDDWLPSVPNPLWRLALYIAHRSDGLPCCRTGFLGHHWKKRRR